MKAAAATPPNFSPNSFLTSLLKCRYPDPKSKQMSFTLFLLFFHALLLIRPLPCVISPPHGNSKQPSPQLPPVYFSWVGFEPVFFCGRVSLPLPYLLSFPQRANVLATQFFDADRFFLGSSRTFFPRPNRSRSLRPGLASLLCRHFVRPVLIFNAYLCSGRSRCQSKVEDLVFS